jgi:hypothetical protein
VERKTPADISVRPSSDFDLTVEERALLADPDWVTEDDADDIISLREAQRGGKRIRLEVVLKRYGHRVVR